MQNQFLPTGSEWMFLGLALILTIPMGVLFYFVKKEIRKDHPREAAEKEKAP